MGSSRHDGVSSDWCLATPSGKTSLPEAVTSMGQSIHADGFTGAVRQQALHREQAYGELAVLGWTIGLYGVIDGTSPETRITDRAF
jgi:hypothetical protein